MPKPPAVYTIASHEPFLDRFAQGLLDLAAGDDSDLADTTVFLPTRRACRALADSFLRLRDGAPMILPSLRPLGDIDDEELAFGATEDDADIELPPAISPLRRRLLLGRLIQARSPELDLAQAARLAVDLAHLLDSLQREDLTLDDLKGITPDAFAEHWQQTLHFLQILAEPWAQLLVSEGASDPVAGRSLRLRRLAEMWRHDPPKFPVVAAGSTGSVPATAALLQVVSTLPRGAVVLPGLDQEIDDDSWLSLDPGHWQFGLKQILEVLGVARQDVSAWPPGTPAFTGAPARMRLFSEAMRPAATTERWRDLAAFPKETLDGVGQIEFQGQNEEAIGIALMMREVLERPGETAALVTPDRKLARRVSVELGRWGVAVDDSAGVALDRTPPGAFLRLVATAFADKLAPISLLAMLKHPLALAGASPSAFRGDVRLVDRYGLRGPKPAPRFTGLLRSIAASAVPDGACRRFEDMSKAAASFEALMEADTATLAELLTTHVAFAEWLSRDEGGEVRLWDGEDGETLAQFVHNLHGAADGLDALDPATYPELLHTMMTGVVVRPRYGRHPRLHIWGPLEARLQQVDLMILSGLNEGTWPDEAATDPWLSRPMRRQIGLPAPERRIGLAAHDFVQVANAPNVVMTRASKDEGAPTVASRWLLRLDNVLNAVGLAWSSRIAEEIAHWTEALDQPEAYRPATPPDFAPPVESRPTRLSVTRVETWMRDPYSIYARYILDLRPLDPLQADPGAAERGIAVHEALDQFVVAYPGDLPENAYERLLSFGREAFGDMLDRPGIRAFWWPRFERIAAWFLETELARRAQARPVASEAGGRLVLQSGARPFTLTAKADRIDRLADGSLAIIDYKTGALPSEAEILRGDAPQLPLEAMIAIAGGFDGVPGAVVSELSFWRLSGGRTVGETRRLRIDAAEAAAAARRGLEQLIARFEDPKTPYRARPRPAAAMRYGDYDHLARIKAWSVVPREAR